MRIIAYNYDADMHCVACTQARFKPQKLCVPLIEGVNIDEFIVPADRDGNPIHPVFDIDEKSNYHTCGTCRITI